MLKVKFRNGEFKNFPQEGVVWEYQGFADNRLVIYLTNPKMPIASYPADVILAVELYSKEEEPK